MKLVLQDIKWNVNDFPELSETIVNNIILKKLGEANIQINLQREPGKYTFLPVNKNKMFISKKENKILLKEGDPRKAELKKKHGRDYLTSERLTEKQFLLLIDSFNGTLDKLNISANIRLYEGDDESNFILIRYGKENGQWPVPNSFPIEV